IYSAATRYEKSVLVLKSRNFEIPLNCHRRHRYLRLKKYRTGYTCMERFSLIKKTFNQKLSRKSAGIELYAKHRLGAAIFQDGGATTFFSLFISERENI